MRLNNRDKAGQYQFLSTTVAMSVVIGVITFLLGHKLGLFGNMKWIFLIVPLFFVAIFYMRGRQIFEYDSDGEALHFKNRNVISILDKPLNDEFPKYKLISYEIVNQNFFKRLFVRISSNKSKEVVLKYDISYLKKQEINDLKLSLSKVVKANNESRGDHGRTE